VDKKEISRLIEKYLDNECLPDEKYLLEKYLDSFQKEGAGWSDDLHGDKQQKEDKIYLDLIRRMKHEEKNIIVRAFYSSALVKVAASVAVLFIIAAGIYFFTGKTEPKADVIAWTERTTVPGEKAIITLNDNSKIVLNAASKIKYPARFAGNKREIYLEGEAFFEVSHDSTKPFLVHTANITTTVLGTKFNVNAYSNDNEISVSLVEGKVKISDQKKTGAEDLIILNPAQRLVYDKEKEISEVANFDQQQETGWKDNILKFNNEPLEKVFTVLERTFGVKFELALKGQAKPKITANFKNESVATITEVLKKLTGLQAKIERENNEIKRIKFYKK
jgi:transmembrane sensor